MQDKRPETFVLDCSVTMAWCFEDESSRYTEYVFDQFVNAAAVVPTIWPLEVANVLLVGERRKRIPVMKSIAFKELLTSLPIHVDPATTQHALGGIVEIGREYRLSAYDAAYLELAVRQNLAIASVDKSVKKAAKLMNVLVFD